MRSLRVLVGLALAFVFLLVFISSAPARLLTMVLPGEQLVMTGLEGTLWDGRASRCILRLPPGYLHLGAVEWSLSPLSLLTLSPRLAMNSTWGSQHFEGELVLRGTQALDVKDFEAQVSADLVQKFAPLAVDGRLSVQLKQFSVREGLPYSGEGRLVWQNAGFNSPAGRVALGSYALEFLQQPGEVLEGEVLSLEGPLLAEGDVSLEGRSYAIDIHLRSEGEMDRVLRQALSLMAVPQGDGYNINLQADF